MPYPFPGNITNWRVFPLTNSAETRLTPSSQVVITGFQAVEKFASE